MPPPGAGKKAKVKAAEPAPREDPEFAGRSADELRTLLASFRSDVEALARERNQAQVDRDAIESFFDVTKVELREVELALLAKEREMQGLADGHRVDVKVYQQKVKHLEYVHGHAMRAMQATDAAAAATDEATHHRREAALRAERQSLRARTRALEEAHAEAVRSTMATHEKNRSKLHEEFDAHLQQLRGAYAGRQAALEAELRMRHRVEVHEVEERKNLHINQLMRAHEEAFNEIRRYYNDVTRANLDLIASLNAHIAEAHDTATANAKLMLEIAEENKRLSDPLQRATAELTSLQADLRDAEKDRQSLRLAKARLKLVTLEASQRELEARYADVERERDELYASFEATVAQAQAKSSGRNEALEALLAEAEHDFASKKTQIDEVLTAAQLDPSIVGIVSAKLEGVLASRDALLNNLKGSVALLSKAHVDTVRVLEARMRTLGLAGRDEASAEPPPAPAAAATASLARGGDAMRQ